MEFVPPGSSVACIALVIGLWLWSVAALAQSTPQGRPADPQKEVALPAEAARQLESEDAVDSEQQRSKEPASLSAHESIEQFSLYVRVVGGIIAAVAALLGLPMVRLRLRKTQAEIEKLDLESQALRNKLAGAETQEIDTGEHGYHIHIDSSPNTNVQVLADPRFLAPLLLLTDFILAWVILTLADYFLEIVEFGLLKSIGLTLLAVFLLVPIAKQALRTRVMLNPDKSEEQIAALIKQLKLCVHFVFWLVALSALAFGAAMLTFGRSDSSSLSVGVAFLVIGTIALILWPLFTGRTNRYLEGLVR